MLGKSSLEPDSTWDCFFEQPAQKKKNENSLCRVVWDLSPLKKSWKKVGKKVGDHGDGILYMNSYI